MNKYALLFASALLLVGCSTDKTGGSKSESYLKSIAGDKGKTKASEMAPPLKVKPGVSSINSILNLTFSPVDVSRFSRAEIQKLYAHLLIQDQQYRDSIHAARAEESTHFWKHINKADSLNQLILSALVHHFGWPTVAKYGSESVETAFLITWHAEEAYKHQYLPSLQEAAKSDTLNLYYYKIIKDRLLLGAGKDQQYNTHHRLPNGVYQVSFR